MCNINVHLQYQSSFSSSFLYLVFYIFMCFFLFHLLYCLLLVLLSNYSWHIVYSVYFIHFFYSLKKIYSQHMGIFFYIPYFAFYIFFISIYIYFYSMCHVIDFFSTSTFQHVEIDLCDHVTKWLAGKLLFLLQHSCFHVDLIQPLIDK